MTFHASSGCFVEALTALSEPPNHRFCTPSVFPDRLGIWQQFQLISVGNWLW